MENKKQDMKDIFFCAGDEKHVQEESIELHCANANHIYTTTVEGMVSLSIQKTKYQADAMVAQVLPGTETVSIVANAAPSSNPTFSISDASPGTLHDVTSENPHGTAGYSSSIQQQVNSEQQQQQQQQSGVLSPSSFIQGGYSVRKYEEQIANLRKENFNLKLRLYFIEEALPCLAKPGDHQLTDVSECGHENLFKQLIDAKVEAEVLRKEVQEKQEILKQAAHAITQMENIQKQSETRYNNMLSELQQKIQYLELERGVDIEKSAAIPNDKPITSNKNIMRHMLSYVDIGTNTEVLNPIQKINELEHLLVKSKTRLEHVQSHTSNMQESLKKRNGIIAEYENQIRDLVMRNYELSAAIEIKNKEIAENMRLIRNLNAKYDDIKEDNRKLIEALNIAKDSFQQEQTHVKTCERRMLDQQDSLKQMHPGKRANESYAGEALRFITNIQEKMKYNEDMIKTALKMVEQLKEIGERDRLQLDLLLQLNTKQQQCDDGNDDKRQEKAFVVALSNESKNDAMDQCESGHDIGAQCDLHLDCQCVENKYKMIINQQNSTIEELKMEIKNKTENIQSLVNKELWEKNREIERLIKIINKEIPNDRSITSKDSPKIGNESENERSFSEAECMKQSQRKELSEDQVNVLLRPLSTESTNETTIMKLHSDLLAANKKVHQAERWCQDYAELCNGLTKRLEQLAGFLNFLLKYKDVFNGLGADRRHAIRKAVNCSLDLSKSLNMTLSLSGISLNDDSYLPNLSNLSLLLNEYNEEDDTNENITQQYDTTTPIIKSLQAENDALKLELNKRRSADNKRERRSLPLAFAEMKNRDSESEAWSEPDRNVSMARIGLETNNNKSNNNSNYNNNNSNNNSNTKEIPIINSNIKQNVDTDSEQSEEKSIMYRSQKAARNICLITQERCQQLEEAIVQRNERILEIQCQLFDADIHIKEGKQHIDTLKKEIEQLNQYNNDLERKLNDVNKADCSRLHAMEEEMQRKAAKIEELNEQIIKLNAKYEEDMLDIRDRHRKYIETVKKELEYTMHERLAAQKNEYDNILKRDWIARLEYDQIQQQVKKLQWQYKEAQSNIECLEENERELKESLMKSELNSRHLQKTIDEATLNSSKMILERTKVYQENLELEKTMQNIKQQLESYSKQNKLLEENSQRLENELKNWKIMTTTATSQTDTNTDDGGVSSQSGYNTSEELLTQRPLRTGIDISRAAVVNRSADYQQYPNDELKRLHNSSPDLGIESDAGRVSSIEMANNTIQLNRWKTIEFKSSNDAIAVNNENEFFKGKEINDNILSLSAVEASTSAPPPTTAATTSSRVTVAATTSMSEPKLDSTSTTIGETGKIHDCAKVEQDNAELRHKLIRTKRALVMTYEKLRCDNQRKAQIEKEIKNQLVKTHSILRNARTHLENEFK